MYDHVAQCIASKLSRVGKVLWRTAELRNRRPEAIIHLVRAVHLLSLPRCAYHPIVLLRIDERLSDTLRFDSIY